MSDIQIINQVIRETEGLEVRRRTPPRSQTPYPTSEDLEAALKPILLEAGFQHHERWDHPKDKSLGGFEYDFWCPEDGVAIEIMGYRADDEVYKDILKFHVHRETRVGALWVPRYKWVGGERLDTNVNATRKAVAFADTYMEVDSLEIVIYDWKESEIESTWLLHYVTVPKEISDDDEYKGWIEEHTGVGFVANLHEPPAIFIHSSDCPEIKTRAGKSGTGGSKIAHDDYRKLVKWCDDNYPGVEINDHMRGVRRCMDCSGAQRDNPFSLHRVHFFMAPRNLAENWRDSASATAILLGLNKEGARGYRNDDYLVLVEGGCELKICALGKISQRAEYVAPEGAPDTPDLRKKLETRLRNSASNTHPLYELVIKFEVMEVLPDPLLREDLDKDSLLTRPEDCFPKDYKEGELNPEDRQDVGRFPDIQYSQIRFKILSEVLREFGPQKYHSVFELPENRAVFRQVEVLKKSFSNCGFGPEFFPRT